MEVPSENESRIETTNNEEDFKMKKEAVMEIWNRMIDTLARPRIK